MGFPRQRLMVLFVFLWLAGCASATLEIGATPVQATLLLSPTPAPPQPSPTPQAQPTATLLLPTDKAVPTPVQPVAETLPPPQVIRFSVAPTPALVTMGDSLSVAWEALGERTELCPIAGSGPIDCQEVALVGSLNLSTDETSLSYIGLGLRVSRGDDFVWSLVDLTVGCQGIREWFFPDAPARCPESEAMRSVAAAQFFEHGLMIWTATPDQFFVFFDEPFSPDGDDPRKLFERILAPYEFAEEKALSDEPPAGLQAPVSGFGRLWRGELVGAVDDAIRGRLGWAVGPEFSYDADYQCEVRTHPRGWTCYLLAPDDRILLLQPDSTAGVHLLWSEWSQQAD